MNRNNIFIHIALLDGWDEIIKRYILLIDNSGLLLRIEKIYICFVGDYTKVHLDFDKNIFQKIIIIYVDSNLESFEVPTQKVLYDFACNNKDSNILYIHTKGVGKVKNVCVEDWVHYMLYFLIENHEKTLEKLEYSDTVGVDLREWPTLHYSGNFWWAKSSYILTLPDPILFKNLSKYPNPLNSERHNQEFWICYDKNKIHCALWECGIHCFERHLHRYTRENYIR